MLLWTVVGLDVGRGVSGDLGSLAPGYIFLGFAIGALALGLLLLCVPLGGLAATHVGFCGAVVAWLSWAALGLWIKDRASHIV